jgi:hypothetical protein
MNNTIVAFEEGNIPPELWQEAQAINVKIAELSARITTRQKLCEHNWQNIMWKNPKYYTRIDRTDMGHHVVIKEFHCPLCNLRKPFDDLPFNVCHKCGGKMIHNGRSCNEIPIHIRNCENCGHEYHST